MVDPENHSPEADMYQRLWQPSCAVGSRRHRPETRSPISSILKAVSKGGRRTNQACAGQHRLSRSNSQAASDWSYLVIKREEKHSKKGEWQRVPFRCRFVLSILKVDERLVSNVLNDKRVYSVHSNKGADDADNVDEELHHVSVCKWDWKLKLEANGCNGAPEFLDLRLELEIQRGHATFVFIVAEVTLARRVYPFVIQHSYPDKHSIDRSIRATDILCPLEACVLLCGLATTRNSNERNKGRNWGQMRNGE